MPLAFVPRVDDRKSNEDSVSVSVPLGFSLLDPSEPTPDELPLLFPDELVAEELFPPPTGDRVAPDERFELRELDELTRFDRTRLLQP